MYRDFKNVHLYLYTAAVIHTVFRKQTAGQKGKNSLHNFMNIYSNSKTRNHLACNLQKQLKNVDNSGIMNYELTIY